jgi:hypothetical protein
MKTLKLKHISIIYIIVCILFPIACENRDTEEFLPERLFRPVSFSATVDVNNVDFSWMPIDEATYVIELSRDSMKFVTDLQSYSFGETSKGRVEDLWGGTRYSARIKSVSRNPAIADSKYKAILFATQVENIFYTVEPDDINTDWVTLKWDNTKFIDLISIVLSGDEEYIDYILSDEEKENGQKTITNLDPGTEYRFGIFLGERNRGYVAVKTGNIFSEVTDDAIEEYQATLIWDISFQPDRIVVSTAEVDDRTIVLSNDDRAAGQKIIENLMPATPYIIRVYSEEQALGKVSITTKEENIFYPVDDNDIEAEQVTLKWDNTKDVDLIEILAEGVDNVFVVLSPEEKAAGEKTITGLTAETAYTFRIYFGETLRGTITADTKTLL